jgi:DNA repair protein RadA/Sms
VGKLKRLFVCSECGRPTAQWSGKCSACGAWGAVSEHPVGSGSRLGGSSAMGSASVARVELLTLDPEEHRISTGQAGVDRVLGGGLVPGSVVLLAGAPGIGKSTLLLQLASGLSNAGHPCLYASGEEARSQVGGRLKRLGLEAPGLRFVPGRDLSEVMAAAEADALSVLMVDSIQTIRDPESDSLPGGPSQVRTCADALIGLAKEQGVTVILVGHVTKDGDVAGPRTLEHAVDAVITFEGDAGSGLRVLSGGKNRFGAEGEVAWFDMTASGLQESQLGPALGGEGEAGSATALAMAGRRALAVVVQALVVPTEGPARRQVAGLDPRRFHIVSAVTDRLDSRFKLGRSEVFGASSGGLRLDEPGADLAIAAAIASACIGRPPPRDTGFVGEVALTGAVRAVAGIEQRLSAAAAGGLKRVVCPAEWNRGTVSLPRPAAAGGTLPELAPVSHLRDALAWAFGRNP